MKHIYSNYYEIDEKITELKKDVLGVVLHDDAENYTAEDYIPWLNNRIKKNELEKDGRASTLIKTLATGFTQHNILNGTVEIHSPIRIILVSKDVSLKLMAF